MSWMVTKFRLAKLDPEFFDMLQRKSRKLSVDGKPISIRLVTKNLATPDFDRLMDAQLSKRVNKLFRIKL